MEKVECAIEETALQYTLGSRQRGAVAEIPAILGKVYGEVMTYLGKNNEAPSGAPFVIYYNEDMQNLDMEIGFPVAIALPGEGAVKAGTIPGGKAATAMHRGPYMAVEATYEKLTGFMKENQLAPVGHVIEYYLNDPAVTPPEELLTKVVFPLR